MLIQAKIHSWIKDAEAERHAQCSSKLSVSAKASSQSRSSRRSSSKVSSRSSKKKRALEERIKMTETEYMEKKQSLEFENLRIQLAAEVVKSKAWVKILEAPSEIPDDAQVTLKSKTSYLGQYQKRREVKRNSQKETEPASTLRKRER